jgi:2-dehydropantoate 2-reductase
MKICVVGAGAIGGILGAQLARTGHTVSLIARGAHLVAIRARGLKLVNHLEGGSESYLELPAESDPAVLAARLGVQDVVIIGLKAHAIPALLGRLAPLIGPKTLVVPAINGVPWWYFWGERGPHAGRALRSLDPKGTLFADLSPSHIIGCVVHLAGEVRAPGEVHYTAGSRLIVGEIDRGLPQPLTPRIKVLHEALRRAGFETRVARDIRTDVWAKLIGNLSFNPVAALACARIDQICADPGLLGVVRPLLREGMEVAAHYGVAVGMTPDERIDLARQLGSAKISMHQDFEANRAPEIDAIVGAVIELAEWGGLEVPAIRMIDALVRARAQNLGLLGPG